MSKDAADNGMMRGRVQVGDPGPYCHRIERLVHLELADIALNAPYLDPKFPNVKADVMNGNAGAAARGPCPDCESGVHSGLLDNVTEMEMSQAVLCTRRSSPSPALRGAIKGRSGRILCAL